MSVTITVSTSAIPYLRRIGVLPTPQTPQMRISAANLVLEKTPVLFPPPHLFLDIDGNPPNDRAGLRPWPPVSG